MSNSTPTSFDGNSQHFTLRPTTGQDQGNTEYARLSGITTLTLHIGLRNLVRIGPKGMINKGSGQLDFVHVVVFLAFAAKCNMKWNESVRLRSMLFEV